MAKIANAAAEGAAKLQSPNTPVSCAGRSESQATLLDRVLLTFPSTPIGNPFVQNESIAATTSGWLVSISNTTSWMYDFLAQSMAHL
jgi:hypothetical protein